MTGVRFVKKYYSSIQKNVVFLQPQFAQLIDLARVNTSTARWVDLPSSLGYGDLHKLDRPGIEEIALGEYAFSNKKAYVTGQLKSLDYFFKFQKCLNF